jgi:threonine/homoserine/homoserine lactone efflux protein
VTLTSYVTFILACMVMQGTPGPDQMLIIGRGIGQGRRAAFFTVFGVFAAGVVQVPLLALGVASLAGSFPLALDALRWVGAAYLIWVGLKLLCAAPARRNAQRQTVPAHFAVFSGMVSNLCNPKVLLFMLAFLPQFVSPSQGSIGKQILLLDLTQKLSGLAVLSAVAFASGTLGDWLSKRAAFIVWQERLAGSVLTGLGLSLVFAGSGSRR